MSTSKHIKKMSFAVIKTGMLVLLIITLINCNQRGTQNAAQSTAGGTKVAQQYPPDNTGKNKRDTTQQLPTPGDQKENQADLNITQQIRQAIVADNTLSTNAKNVKIITKDGVVTLRGPVESMQEKDMIVSKAQQVAGVTRVDNQLEVNTQATTHQ